jgi:hypothetical protein
MPYKLGDKTLQLDVPWEHNGIQYPANWLRRSTSDDRVNLGITWEPDVQASWDQRFYWGVDNPKDHAQLQELWIAKVKETAGSLLAQTDWYITRRAETRKSVPQAVLDRRTEIREYSDEKEAAILASVDTAGLAAYVTSAAFSAWEALPEPEPTPEPTPEPEPTFSGGFVSSDAGEDVIVFSGMTTSAGITEL